MCSGRPSGRHETPVRTISVGGAEGDAFDLETAASSAAARADERVRWPRPGTLAGVGESSAERASAQTISQVRTSSSSTSTFSAPADDQVEVLGRDPEAGPLDGDHVRLEHRAGRAGRGSRSGCGGRARTSPRAPPGRARPCGRRRGRPGPRGCPRPSPRSSSGSSANGWSGPSIVRSSVKCFSTNAAPSAAAAIGTAIPVGVVGEADRDAEGVAHRRHRAQVRPLGAAPGRPTCTASARRRSAPASRGGVERLLDLAHRRHPGGDQQRPPGRGGRADQRQVDDLERGDLEHGHVERVELGDRLVVERAGEEVDAALARVVGELGLPLARQRDLLEQLGRRLVADPLEVLELRRLARVDARCPSRSGT